jgi:flagellar basal body-associated protein FliL
MSDQHIDPAGNTQQFRAFAQRAEQEAPRKKSPLLPILIAVAVVVIIGVTAFLALR